MWEAVAPYAASLEASALGVAARTATWLYPFANLVHVLGAALVVGAIATFDVQILRGAPRAGLVVRAGMPVAVVGFLLQLASGVVLISAEATTVIRNPAFVTKMAFLLLALANVAVFHLRFHTALTAGRLPPGAKMLALVSLTTWSIVLLAGRAIAYL